MVLLSDLHNDACGVRAEVFFRIKVAADAVTPAASKLASDSFNSEAVVFPTELKDTPMQDPQLCASELVQVRAISQLLLHHLIQHQPTHLIMVNVLRLEHGWCCSR